MTAAQGRIFIEQTGLIDDGILQVRDHILAGSAELKLQIDTASYLLIIPVTGDLFCKDTQNEGVELNVSELKLLAMPKGSTIIIVNPYEAEVVNFLEIRLNDPFVLQYFSYDNLRFDFEVNDNVLIEVFSKDISQNLPLSLSMGRFAGRTEATYPMKESKEKFFAFAISGAFEVEGRLLHPRDGLSLWNVNAVEIEALSNHAILLVLAYGYK